MKKNFKITLVVTLLFVSLCCKALLTYEIINEAWMFDVFTEAFFGLKAEYFVYAVDAVLTVMIFSFAEKRMQRLYSKIILIISTVMFYLLFVSAFNYLWQSIELNTMLKWEEPLFNPIYLAIGGIKRYFETGRPQYHTAIICLMVVLSAIVVFRRYKKSIFIKIKMFLMKRAEKSDSYTSLNILPK